jgi:hypothetical protein
MLNVKLILEKSTVQKCTAMFGVHSLKRPPLSNMKNGSKIMQSFAL